MKTYNKTLCMVFIISTLFLMSCTPFQHQGTLDDAYIALPTTVELKDTSYHNGVATSIYTFADHCTLSSGRGSYEQLVEEAENVLDVNRKRISLTNVVISSYSAYIDYDMHIGGDVIRTTTRLRNCEEYGVKVAVYCNQHYFDEQRVLIGHLLQSLNC